MDEHATLSETAEAEITALLADGIFPTPAEIVELNALGWAVETPETRRLLARGRPVFVGGTFFWPLTMRAVDWLDRNHVPLTEVSRAMGYAMAHCQSGGNELDTEGREARKAVDRWYMTLACTPDQFEQAVRQVDFQDRRPELPDDGTGRTMTLGDFSAFLSGVCGADADFWERRCSVSFCLSVLSRLAMHNHADKFPCRQDPKILAVRALGYAVDRIRQKRVKDCEADNG